MPEQTEISFRNYFKHLYKNHLHEAKPWARDQILWASFVIIAIPLLAALRVGKKIDWPFFWTCLEFYFVAFLIYAVAHIVRAGWKAYQGKEKQIAAISELMTEKDSQTSYLNTARAQQMETAAKLSEECTLWETRARSAEGMIGSKQKELDGVYQQLQGKTAEVNRLQGELAKWQDVSVNGSDPQVYAEFCDDRGATPNKERQAYITLFNRGGSDALNVCIDPIHLKDHVINFPKLAYAIEAGKARHRYPDITTSDNKTPHHTSVFSHVAYDDVKYHELSEPEMALPFTVTYQDAAHNLYEARCELVFDPAAHSRVMTQGQNGSFVVLKTRNHQFRKIALAANQRHL